VTLRFVVPGRPQSWKRTTTDPKTGRRLTPRGMRQAKALVRQCVGFAMREHMLDTFEGPLRVRIDVYRRRKRDATPDADNYAKLVLDAANTVAWTDDAQVVELTVRKHDSRVTGGAERTVVVVEPAEDEEPQRRVKVRRTG